jgi:hypothetical protein
MEALARSLSATELAKFAAHELDNLQLVLPKTPAVLTELVARVDDLAMKADQLDALLDDNTFADAAEVGTYIDKVKDIADKFGVDDIHELEKELAALKESMDEFDLVNTHDLCCELKRLKKLAQRIEDACTEASIEI